MSDLTREAVACAGQQEGLNFALNSINKLTAKMLLTSDSHIVKIGNPRTIEFNCGRSSQIPGFLKWMQHNKTNNLPIKLFEQGDVILKTDDDTGVRNERRLCAIYSNNKAKFEKIQGHQTS